MALIGIDIGTQGAKAAIFTDDGACLAQAFCPSQLHRPKPGVVEEDPENQFSSVCQTIRKALKQSRLSPRDIVAVGIDGQMAGIIGLGSDGRHITPYDSWLDTRCCGQIAQMEKMAGDEILAKTGCAPSFNHGPKILWWMKNHPKIYRRVAVFVQPAVYAAMRLCGLVATDAYIDTTYLHFSGFADNAHARWDDSLCKRFKLDRAKLPRIVNPQAIVGQIVPAAARRCGLAAGTPVIAGCGDTAASFLSCGAVRAGIGIDVAGTASVFAATTATLRADQKNRILGCGRSVVPGLWHPYAYINGGGMNLEWFSTQIANRGKHRGANLFTLKDLDAIATTIRPSLADPFFVPHLAGRVCPAQPNLRGAWIGLQWDHTLGHLYRAVLESVALEYGIYQRILGELYPDTPIRELRITGGGEKSIVWNTLKSQVLQTTVSPIENGCGATRGVAMLAGWGVGLFKDLPATAKKWITVRRGIHPKYAMKSHYAHRLNAYEQLLKHNDGRSIPIHSFSKSPL